MPFDGLTIRALTRELNRDLSEARIDKIHQPEKDELVFSIRTPHNGSVRLVISANPRWARLHISTEKKPNPTRPSSFCMLLRKYLEGSKIKAVEQIGMERIVYIRIEALNDFREWQEKLLICEFMGRHSNIILVNSESEVIIDAIKKVSSEVSTLREVLPGKPYTSPPTQGKLDPITADFQQFAATMWNQGENMTVANALFKAYTGLSPYSAREICAGAGLDGEQPVEECGELELERIFTRTRATISAIDAGQLQPSVQSRKNLPLEFSPYLPLIVAPGVTVRSFATMNFACDAYYLQQLSQLRLQSMQTNLSRGINDQLHKAYRKKFLQEGDLSQALENEKYKLWGELLTAYAHRYQKGDTLAVLADFNGGADICLPLDPRYTPIQNAQRFFKIYRKSRGAQLHLQRLMHENQAGIEYLESVLVAIGQAQNPDQIEEIMVELEREKYLKPRSNRIKSKPTPSQPRRYMSSDGWTIQVGRNNLQNDRLTLRESGRQDLWLHAKETPGTHVIVSVPAGINSIHDIPDRTLEDAASLAAYFSKASSAQKVAVDYTFRSNVKKPGGAKPGMVIYENYWTILVDPSSKRLQQLLEAELDTKSDH